MPSPTSLPFAVVVSNIVLQGTQDLTALGKIMDGEWTRASNENQNLLQVHCITKDRVNWS